MAERTWKWGQDRCRHPRCPDTNWGGTGRVHVRGEECPPDPEGEYLHWRPEDGAFPVSRETLWWHRWTGVVPEGEAAAGCTLTVTVGPTTVTPERAEAYGVMDVEEPLSAAMKYVGSWNHEPPEVGYEDGEDSDSDDDAAAAEAG